MQAHRIVFRFDGGLADRGLLDASDLIAYDAGVRQLLGLHAHFLMTGGKVPRGGVLTEGPGYHIYSKDPKVACYEGHWIVELGIATLRAAAGPAVGKVVEYTYEHLLKDSLGPILSRRQSSMPLDVRMEPVLPGLDRINSPVFDVEAERQHRWGQLRERATIIMPNAFRPVGKDSRTGARTLVIRGENLEVLAVDEADMRRLLEDAEACADRRVQRLAEVTAAVTDLKRNRPPVRSML